MRYRLDNSVRQALGEGFRFSECLDAAADVYNGVSFDPFILWLR